MRYRPEIDGLRALAVIPVIFFHAGFETFQGGFIGVDIFFVISGYLIASIIFEEKLSKKFTLINFYERRSRRILPALFFVMIICIPFAWFWMMQDDLILFSKSLIFVSSFISNILFWQSSGYFQISSELNPLLHTWSLAIEEQFYLIFPIVIIIFWKFGIMRIFNILFIFLLISLTLSHWGADNKPSANFYLPLTRAWEILLGVLVSIYIIKKKKIIYNSLSETLSLIGFFILIISFIYFDKNTLHPSFYTFIPATGTILIILFSNENSIIGKLLGSKLFVSVGLMSYSLYLWHQPIFAFSRIRSFEELDIFFKIGLIILAFILAYLSWKYIELPFRNKKKFNQKKIFSFIIIFIIIFWILGLIGYSNKGFVKRLKLPIDHKEFEFPKINNGWCFYSVDDTRGLKTGKEGLNCWVGKKDSKIKGLLFGDSFAGQYEPFWDKIGNTSNIKINSITTNYCLPGLNYFFVGPKDSRANYQCKFNKNFVLNHISDYDFLILGGAWGSAEEKNNILNTLNLIDDLSNKVKLILIMPDPKIFETNILKEYMKSIKFNKFFDVSKFSNKKDIYSIEAHKKLEKISSKYENVIFINRDSIFATNLNSYKLTEQIIPYSFDGSHISIYGSNLAAENFILSDKYKLFLKMLYN